MTQRGLAPPIPSTALGKVGALLVMEAGEWGRVQAEGWGCPVHLGREGGVMYWAETWPYWAEPGCCSLYWGHPVLTGRQLLHTRLKWEHPDAGLGALQWPS